MFYIPVTGNIQNHDGTDARFGEDTLTVRNTLIVSLMTISESDAAVPIEARWWRNQFAEKILKNDMVLFSLGDVISIMPLVQRVYTHPNIISSLIKLFEQHASPIGPSTITVEASQVDGGTQQAT